MRRTRLAPLVPAVALLAVVSLAACDLGGSRPAASADPPQPVPLAARLAPPLTTGSPPVPVAVEAPVEAPAVGARLRTAPEVLPPEVFAGTADHHGRSVVEYGARPDDGADDTAALRRALDAGRIVDGTSIGESPDDYHGREKVLYLPPGRYDVSGSLSWTGCCVTLRGAGSGSTQIRLADGARGFGDPDEPRPVIATEDSNEAFRNNVIGLTVDTGRDNAGAVGVSYIASNHGVMRDVLVRSGDGAGVAGIDMTRRYAGPALLQDVEVRGFDLGLDVGEPYQMTFERITLRDQRDAALRCASSHLAMRQVLAEGAAPFFAPSADRYENVCSITLIESELRGGVGGAAIRARGDNSLFLRDVTASGFDSVLAVDGRPVGGREVAEYATRSVDAAGRAGVGSLDLPVAEVPTVVEDPVEQWSRAYAPEYNNSSRIAPAFDTDASTVYFTSETYLLYDRVRVEVPGNVVRVAGYHSTINSDSRGRDGGGLLLVVGDGTEPLVVDGFGYGVTIEHRGNRPVVLRDGKYGYRSTPDTTGDLWFENVEVHGFTLRAGQRLWARQWNDESSDTKIVNEGGDLWLFGMKTERPSTVLRAEGGRTEMLGVLLYPAQPFAAGEDSVAFDIGDGARFSAVYDTNVFLDGRRDEYRWAVRSPSGDLRSEDLHTRYDRVGLVTATG